jgi:hypothetical protein
VSQVRAFAKLAVPLAALAVLAIAPSAVADTSMPRDWVPASALVPYHATADRLQNVATQPNSDYGLVTVNGIGCIADPAGTGAMGYHYADIGLIFDHGTLDASAPEAVVYAPTQGGDTQVVALEYIVPQADWDATHSSAPELFPGHQFMLTGAPNRFGLPAFYSQHVWVGRGNPLGNLAMWNPAIHC